MAPNVKSMLEAIGNTVAVATVEAPRDGVVAITATDRNSGTWRVTGDDRSRSEIRPWLTTRLACF